MLSQPAKLLLSRHPELIKEIANAYISHPEDNVTFSSPDEYWTNFLQTNQPNNADITKFTQEQWIDFSSKLKEAAALICDVVNAVKKNNCPHCGIPTDGTSNEQCWKAPKKEDWEIVSRLTDGQLWVDKETNERVYGSIKSVRRLSDGEVFTVGDSFRYKYPNGTFSDVHVIEKIEVPYGVPLILSLLGVVEITDKGLEKSKPTETYKVDFDPIIPSALSSSMKSMVKDYVNELLAEREQKFSTK